MSPASLREAFQLISAADKVLSNVANHGEGTPGGSEWVRGGEGDKPGPPLRRRGKPNPLKLQREEDGVR